VNVLTTTRRPAAPAGDRAPQDRRARTARRLAGAALTGLAALLVLFALVVPNQISRLPEGYSTASALVRVPLEGLVAVAVLVLLPVRARGRVAGVLGAVLGLLTVVKIVDMGFFAVLSRPVDPVLDWVLVDDAVRFLTDALGRSGAVATVVAAALLAVAVVVLMTLAVRRLARVLAPHRAPALGSAGVLGVAWLACSLLGTSLVPGVHVAAHGVATLALDKARQIPAGLHDREVFAAETAVDAFRATPGDQLLGGLRGKDVVVAFVESYGRDAIEDPALAAPVTALLDDGNRRLGAAGYAARSGFLTSPTTGGGSWLAHATFLSGLWVDNEQRYRSLVSGDRLTLTAAFRRAQWRTVGVEPANTYAWPEGAFYGYDRVYDAYSLGYRGPKFSWSTMPDQYTLAAFRRLEHARTDRGPLMAEVTLTSSHTPWAPVPRFLDWDAIGDGTVYGPMAAAGDSAEVVWRDPARVRAEYARSVQYSLASLVSYVERYGDDNLVLVVLGDHQPAPVVTGPDAGRDVPVTVVARDRAVLDRIAGWGWHEGLRPGPQAPVWPMDTFRDRFLTAYAR
jgi:hypothetical protein